MFSVEKSEKYLINGITDDLFKQRSLSSGNFCFLRQDTFYSTSSSETLKKTYYLEREKRSSIFFLMVRQL
jgi:hypothetical protein